jgi:C1A family cysteine protease/GH25 family lysozyme M1 (1,4-beta-N-acetylmuramidase)
MTRPFDPKAASLYGQFVQAAYSMFSAAPADLTPPQSDDFPDGYRMVAWIQMQDFILGSTTPLFYGLIAQNTLVANQFVVAIRGTANGVEWWDDLYAAEQIPFRVPDCGKVADGFARIYDTLEVVECPVVSPAPAAALPLSMRTAGSFSQQISALIRRHAPTRAPARGSARAAARASTFSPSASVEVTGHSLGAALATLYTMENAKTDQIANPMLCTFASPLVGDATFASAFNALGLSSWRVDNAQDLVTKVPPAILGFVHVDTEVPVDSAGHVMPNVVCWHSLATYLSLIDPTQQPSPGCQLPLAVAPPRAAAAAPQGQGAVNRVFRPVAIDLYQGDNVEDTPGPLGGFARVKASGIAFLLHKASEGVTEVDSRYQARRAAWMNGIPVTVTDVDGTVLQLVPKFAAYHYLIGQDPEAEAQHFLATAQLQPGDDAAVDWEQSSGSAYPPSADAVDAFCNVVEKALGFPIIVYSGNVAKELLKGVDSRFAKRRLWLCQYNSTFKIQQSWPYPWLWQDNGDNMGPGPNSIPGIDGNCDNSTIASPMTVKRLYDEWGGGAQAMAAMSTRPAPSFRAARPYSRRTEFTGTRRKIAGYGWKPDLPDQRDHSFAVPSGVLKTIPGVVDLRLQCPPVYTQGQIGSCTANAIAAALEFDMMKQNSPALPPFTPSRLFIYYNERSMEGTVGSDSGAFIRDGIKSVASQGDCPESEWTYDGTAPQLPGNVFAPGAKAAMAPSPQCYADAIRHKALSYQSVDQNLADMKGCLSSGYPFVFGFTVYPSFESDDVARSGMVPMPASDETTIGGHAVLAVGYDDSKNMFIVRNSWGPYWGIAGYCYMPYAYLLDDNLASDFWTIRGVD